MHSLRYSRDGLKVAVGCKDGSVRFFDAGTCEIEEGSQLSGPHEGEVVQVAWSHDGRLFSASETSVRVAIGFVTDVCLWD